MTERQRIRRFPFAIAMINRQGEIRPTPAAYAEVGDALAMLDLKDCDRSARSWSVYAGGYAVIDRRDGSIIRSIAL